MSFWRKAWRHPHQLWLRRSALQVHLWIGILLAAYLSLIGITGSILVFGAELTKILQPLPSVSSTLPSKPADLKTVIEQLVRSFPATHAVSIEAPSVNDPRFHIRMQNIRAFSVSLDARTAAVLPNVKPTVSRLEWVYNLHENLLAARTGRLVNGAGASLMLLAIFTGLINWWPGVGAWRRAVTIDFRRRWRRINFDLHSAVGFWSATLLVIWASTGVYFTWPAAFRHFVEKISPVVNAQPPTIKVEALSTRSQLDFDAMLARALAENPGTVWKEVVFPASRRSPLEFLLTAPNTIGRDYETTVYFNPYNGSYITSWHYSVKRTLGDWIIWLQIPLHFGTHWGLFVKLLWALAGLSLPVLAASGLIMYWNRSLSKKWNQLSRPV